jgi:predicted exporter
MKLPYFNRVVYGPDRSETEALYQWVLKNLPNLLNDGDMRDMSVSLTPGTIQARIADIYRQLSTPEGMALKNLFRADPLRLHTFGFEKIMLLNLIPKVRLSGNHFISSDGNNTLILAETPIENTDFRGGKMLIDHLHMLIKTSVPPDIQVSFISGHRYTVANADTMKRDVWVVLSCSSFFILILFVAFFRNWQALFVFFTPFSVLCLAAAGISVLFSNVSAVTIGFGAVLLGISVDFALHVYFALRQPGSDQTRVVGEVARPVLLSGITTMGAFGVLLFSSLPGQRQLAVFTLIGIVCSLAISLIVLPHLIKPAAPGRTFFHFFVTSTASRKMRQGVIAGWLILLMFCIINGKSLRFEGDLSTLFLAPKEIYEVERYLKKTWGDFRHSAMIIATGTDLQSSLEANDRLYFVLSKKVPPGQIISLAPVLPSASTQKTNHARWAAFWSEKTGKAILDTLTKEADDLGFAPKAFEPFFIQINRSVTPVTRENLKQNGWAPLLEAMIIESADRFQIMTLVPDTRETTVVFDGIKETMPFIRMVSQNRFKTYMGRSISRDFFGFLAKASLVVVILVGFFFHNLKKVLLALVPVLTGVLVMAGIMGWFGIGFNLFNIIATLLVIGLSVDYGIFMVCQLSDNVRHHTELAVLVSGLTTLAGFGALALARHPALNSIGVTVLLGIGAAIPAALWVIPAFYPSER